MDTSDETNYFPVDECEALAEFQKQSEQQFINSFVENAELSGRLAKPIPNDPQPGTSGYRPPPKPHVNPEKIVDGIVKDMELSEARVYDVPGNHSNSDFIHSMMVHQNYFSVALHVDCATKTKIIEGQYVDFAKLIPKDRVIAEEDNWVQLVIKGGNTFLCRPVTIQRVSIA